MPIHGYPGNIITANPTAPTSSVASGVWTTEQQLQAKAAGNWPFTIPTQQISNSLRFNSADSAYLNRTFASVGNRTTWTYSVWLKRSSFGSYQRFLSDSSNNSYLRFGTGDALDWNFWNGTTSYGIATSQVFRDPSAWYHIMVAVDTTQATAANRVKLYVNGSQITAFSSASYPAQNATSNFNNNTAHYISGYSATAEYLSGYLTEINFIDGQALTPSSFGQTNASTGVWEPIAYTGTYGTNGFYLNFSDNSGTTSTTLGKDYSGNGNNWTPNNFSVTAGVGNDSLTDTPTAYGTDTGVGGELRGNFCTLNPIGPGAGTIANGNLQYTAQDNYGRLCTFGLSTGKWYWESTATATEYLICGLISQAASYGSLYDPTQASGYNDYGGYPGPCYGINISGGGTSYKVDQTTATTYGPQVAPVNGDVFMFAVDFDAGKFWVGKNGTWMASGDPVAGTNATWSSMTATTYFVGVHGYGTPTQYLNFGQRPFAYTAPSGFKCMAVQNFSTPTIGATSTTQANDYFDVLTWTSTGTTQTITGTQFQPDLAWTKARSSTSGNVLNDAVRGASKYLISYSTGAETTDANFLTSFNSNGLTFGTGQYALNTTVVGWLWRAAGSTVSNTAGTITSTVSANTTSGFSIVTSGVSTSAFTVGHGLGVAPAMMISKTRNVADSWYVYHQSLAATESLRLNTTGAVTTGGFNGTRPTSTVLTLSGFGSSSYTNVVYCFAPVAGYSAFGSFTGNGSTDGPFVYLGFRPRWVLIKSSSAVTNWWVWDTARNTYNVMNTVLYPDLSNAEYSDSSTFLMDDLSNGFKYRTSNSTVNGSGTTYIYAAFAESPFKYSLAR